MIIDVELFNDAANCSHPVNVAYDYHGGQWSDLYSFASTGGTVHNQEHRDGLECEIESILRWDDDSFCDDPEDEKRNLQNLLHVVQNAEIGVPFEG